jgi:autotransporter-associated beta strand protein
MVVKIAVESADFAGNLHRDASCHYSQIINLNFSSQTRANLAIVPAFNGTITHVIDASGGFLDVISLVPVRFRWVDCCHLYYPALVARVSSGGKMRRKWSGWIGTAPIIFGATNFGVVAAQNVAFSPNWSGFLDLAPSGGAFTDIDATWVIPTVHASASGTTYTSDWIGFDGANGLSDPTVEQCGTSESITSLGSATYVAWYEFAPLDQINVSLTVNPGDTINAEVTYEPTESSPGDYVYLFDLSDVTTGKSFKSTESTSSNDARSSAEWINEAPDVGSSEATLANYGTVTFSNDVAALNGGSDQALSTLSNAYATLMSQNSKYYSVPTSLDSTGEGFSVIYGPNLVWNNVNASSPDNGQTWDISNNENWSGYFNNSTEASVPIVYTNGVNVTFNDYNNGHYAVTLNTTVTPASVNVAATGNYTISGTGTIGGTGYLIKSGAGILTLSTPNTYTGGTTVTNGRLLVEPTSSTTSALPKGTLSISGGTVQLADNVTAGTALGTSNVVLTSLSLTGTGTLDIGNNRIIVDYSSPATDPIASIESWISNGYYGVSGPAIISSDITTDDAASGLSYGIGYADGADHVVAGLPSGEIEIMFTLLGDANLDGTVNSEDFSPFSHNLGQSGMRWDGGDFNYDGTVNSEDFSLFSHNLGQTASLAAAAGVLEPVNGVNLVNVPEPVSGGLITLAGSGVLLRRRRANR